MAFSSVLVIGPIPPNGSCLRIRLGTLLIATCACLAVSTSGFAVSLGWPVVTLVPGPSSTGTGTQTVVRSEPPGAAIFSNGREIGRTPAGVEVPPGNALTLRRDGYLDAVV